MAEGEHMHTNDTEKTQTAELEDFIRTIHSLGLECRSVTIDTKVGGVHITMKAETALRTSLRGDAVSR